MKGRKPTPREESAIREAVRDDLQSLLAKVELSGTGTVTPAAIGGEGNVEAGAVN